MIEYKNWLCMDEITFQKELAQGIQYRTDGHHELARHTFDSLLIARPDDALLHYQMAWTCDAMGAEHAAVPYYERAVELGLTGADLRGALLGMGSTHRTLGNYTQAAEVLEQGLTTFEDGREFAVFLAMAYYNLGRHQEAMQLLLQTIADTSDNAQVQRYRCAIEFYLCR
ncbi:MAG: tetratricopeptide repeat protein [Chloroflexi bacterium AL-W]|nr:tetratricopeptide repeat protein [Chloroflexi bacterium AL-N1]NOK66429.1 tetratricopeptide repeat protein [Chloroflexi bacterium AL-N10]NOK71817.1 tetratricopeptide repeat protein [Chloroflexi bacterium AL-N5]NOK81074.1 tetratricopeptide repeat protein [Chloroflexi bacterium AL-W]NOK89347.1 tetratricopeptide repeat protein [Chloroflexi bacterium AL-N15]